MDPDVRSNQPGTCRRCGMKLREGIPEPVEFHMDLTLTPRAVKPNQTEQLKFTVHDPWKDRPVKDFQIVHEKLFHMFVVSQDLQFFVHDHPVFQPDGDFLYNLAFPKPGMYRVLGDFYPDGATPQLIAKTVFVPGYAAARRSRFRAIIRTKQTENMQVEMTTDPPQPIAAQKTLIYFRLITGRWPGEIYRRVGAHAGRERRFDRSDPHPSRSLPTAARNSNSAWTFPRARTYRVWVQFQRKGVVNTAHFDIPVKELE